MIGVTKERRNIICRADRGIRGKRIGMVTDDAYNNKVGDVAEEETIRRDRPPVELLFIVTTTPRMVLDDAETVAANEGIRLLILLLLVLLTSCRADDVHGTVASLRHT